MTMYSLLGFIVFNCVIVRITSFNIAFGGNTEKAIYHPRQSPALDGNRRTAYTGREKKAMPFFGSNVLIGKSIFDGSEIIETIVAAPSEHVMSITTFEDHETENSESRPAALRSQKSTPAMGAVYSCGMRLKYLVGNISGVSTCESEIGLKRGLTGYDLGERDALGVSLTSNHLPENLTPLEFTKQRRIVSCAHLRMHNCGTVHKAEGACYVSKTVQGRGDGRFNIEWKKRVPCREDCKANNIDMVFLIDGSASIRKSRFEKVKEWIINVASGFDLTSQVRAGVVQYSHWYHERSDDNQQYLRTEIELGQFKDAELFNEAVRNIEYQGFTTYTAHAILKVVREDFNSAGSRYPEAQRIMVLLTDGNSTDVRLLPSAISVANDAKVTSFAVGVEGYVRKELEMIAGSPDRVFTVDKFDELAGIAGVIHQGIQSMEGANKDPTITNDLMQCQAGISSDISQVMLMHHRVSPFSRAIEKSRNNKNNQSFAWEA